MYTKLGSCLLIWLSNCEISSNFSFFDLLWSTDFGMAMISLRKTISLKNRSLRYFFSGFSPGFFWLTYTYIQSFLHRFTVIKNALCYSWAIHFENLFDLLDRINEV